MGALLGPHFLALSRTIEIAEGAVLVVILVLLVVLLVLTRRRKRDSKPAAPAQNYYADLEQKPAGQPDPFAAMTATAGGGAPFAAGPTGLDTSAVAPPAFAAVPAAEPAAMVATPTALGPIDAAAAAVPASAAPAPAGFPSPLAPGTPPGWLPDPSGAPDTLRYWDGSTWTPHFAQRS